MNELLRIIHEIGRGPRGARDLPIGDARTLWRAILSDRLSPAAVGAALMAMRLKGESVDELRALRGVVGEYLPAVQTDGAPLVCMPCYNGARRVPNLSWLTALSLRRAGFAVLMHGVRRDPGRVASCEVVEAAGGEIAGSVEAARKALSGSSLAFLPIDVWCPPLAMMLARRAEIGVRNSGHTIAKLLRPSPDALLLAPVTHNDYVTLATTLLGDDTGPAFVFRGVDGEPTLYPNAPRTLHRIATGPACDPSRLDQCELRPEIAPDPAVTLPADASPREIADWSAAVMRGSLPMPSMIAALTEQAARAAHVTATKP